MGIPNAMKMYNTALLTETQTFLKSINSCYTASLYPHFSQGI